jgi:uncharacterized protein
MDKYPDEIRKQLRTLPDKARLLFAVLTCEHLYPNYVHFQQVETWGNAEVLREAIDIIYQYLINDSLYTASDFEALTHSVELITPDMDDFSGITTSFALDACTAVLSTLAYLLEPALDHLVAVATYARDTVDMYIQVRDDFDSSGSDSTIEDRIANDPLMIQEKARQRQLLDTLKILNIEHVAPKLIEGLISKRSIIRFESL